MPDPTPKRWNVDEFLAWNARQELKHELIDGEIRLKGSHRRKDRERIVFNVLRHLSDRLRAKEVATGDKTSEKWRKLFDFADGEFADSEDPRRLKSRVLFEITSPDNGHLAILSRFDAHLKVPEIRTIVIVAHDRARVEIHQRHAWDERAFDNGTRDDFFADNARVVAGLDDVAPLNELSVVLPLVEIYQGFEKGALLE